MVMTLMPLIGGFIGLIIILGVGVVILSNSTISCSGIPGFNATVPSAGEVASPRTNQAPHSTLVGFNQGWAESCLDNQDNAINGYALLIIAVIVFAAVIILSIIRLLG